MKLIHIFTRAYNLVTTGKAEHTCPDCSKGGVGHDEFMNQEWSNLAKRSDDFYLLNGGRFHETGLLRFKEEAREASIRISEGWTW